jgi:hypothetical protein
MLLTPERSRLGRRRTISASDNAQVIAVFGPVDAAPVALFVRYLIER